MQEGAAKGTKAPQKSPAKAQAHMLRTSRRSTDSDEELMYELAFLVRPSENIDRQTGAMGQSMVQEVDSPFSMDQIRMSIMDKEPARERANLVRIRAEPEERTAHPGLTKIMIEPDIKATCAVAEPKAWG